MKKEYTQEELGQGVRGKYYASDKRRHNVVKLDPEVSQVFPDEESVNEALMGLIRIARVSTARKKSGE